MPVSFRGDNYIKTNIARAYAMLFTLLFLMTIFTLTCHARVTDINVSPSSPEQVKEETGQDEHDTSKSSHLEDSLEENPSDVSEDISIDDISTKNAIPNK